MAGSPLPSNPESALTQDSGHYRQFLGPTSAIRKSDLLASISLLLVRKSDLLVSVSLLLVSKSHFLASISLLLVRKSDLLVSISLLLVSKSDFLVADELASICPPSGGPSLSKREGRPPGSLQK